MADIEVTMAGKTASVTLNRPATRNAVTLAMWKDIARVFGELGSDREVRAILLSGAGGNFSVGADVSEFSDVRNDAGASREYETCVDAASGAIAAVPQAVIAVMHGYCIGGGCHLALACDFRYAHPSASIGIPAAKLSIVYSVQSTQRLLSLVGPSQAKKILFGAERMDADQAYRIGLVERIADDPDVDARTFAQSLAGHAPLSIAGAKYILNDLCAGGSAPNAQVLIDHSSNSHDYREARRAFAEKRQPVFHGR
ncbi:MAG: enoyl-CoA hydratase-related protein [Beijerinckiaceae bacterium]